MRLFESELRDALASMKRAIEAYKSESTTENSEYLCIYSRALKTMFEECSCWNDTVDEAYRGRIVETLSEAVAELKSNAAPPDPELHQVFLDRVAERRDAVCEFDLAAVPSKI